MSKLMPMKIQNALHQDIELLSTLIIKSITGWNPDLQERRLTLEELAKVIHAGKDDIDIILSPNTKTYWLYSNVLNAYCDMDYAGWEQEESFIEKLVKYGEHLYPTMVWTFGSLDL